MTKDLLILVNNGSEEVEALTVLDFARRAGLEVDLCSVNNNNKFKSSHSVEIICDVNLDDIDYSAYKSVYLPGGLPGAEFNAESEKVQNLIKEFHKNNKYIFSVCAGPLALTKSGISGTIKGTCYPGFESKIGYKEFKENLLVQDKNICTSRGPATTAFLALKIIALLKGKEIARKIAEQTLWTIVFENIKEFERIFD